MRADPVWQLLAQRGFGESVAGRTEHRHEDLGTTNLASLRIHNRDAITAVVDEQLLADLVGLAHGELEAAAVLAVMHAELRVLVGQTRRAR